MDNKADTIMNDKRFFHYELPSEWTKQRLDPTTIEVDNPIETIREDLNYYTWNILVMVISSVLAVGLLHIFYVVTGL